MAKFHQLPPSAASLTASLRDLGYSLETAVADLIDNSISAEATEIDVFCDMSRSTPVLVIVDNGRGMLEDEVIAALRHGATDPRKKRGPKDLGRFGLGLKTASFSQCRRLTVVSTVKGKHAGAEWNLDDVEKNDEWLIAILDSDEIAAQPYFEDLGDTGTLIIWRDLDRLFEDETGRRRDEIVSEKLTIVERHLSLVFHRFLAGEVKGRRKLTIRINGHPITPFDPFCRKNEATQILPRKPYGSRTWRSPCSPTSCHTTADCPLPNLIIIRTEAISSPIKGAYVYRNGRLMAWGDWFRMVPKGEATKLARVQIDFPNSLDEAWTIDIKKSRARPPHAVRERLRQIIAKIAARSVTVHRGRGQRLFQENEAPLWERYADHGGIRFEINAEHPLVTSISKRLPPEDADICACCSSRRSILSGGDDLFRLFDTSTRVQGRRSGGSLTLDRLKALKQVLYGDGPSDLNAFLQIVESTHLFDNQIEMVKSIHQRDLDMSSTVNTEERNIANALISGLANLTETPTREQVEVKAKQIAAIFGYTGDLRNIITEAMISVDTRMGSGVSLVDVAAKHDDQWVRKREDIDWTYTNAYEKFLRQEGWPPPMVTSLSDVTNRILGLLQDPRSEGTTWNRRGLVIGHVQSGKTANYTGLIARAADAGYKFIVVIAGIHNNLRRQTQERIDEAFIGRSSDPEDRRAIGVGLGPGYPHPATLTNINEDFNKNTATKSGWKINDFSKPIILVIKKNVTTLSELHKWLKDLNAKGDGRISDVPML